MHRKIINDYCWIICLELNWFVYDPSWMLHLSEFVWFVNEIKTFIVAENHEYKEINRLNSVQLSLKSYSL